MLWWDAEMGQEKPFKGVDKAHVIQEARMFNQPDVDPGYLAFGV
jgi:hypothetical protein